jgi:hypothetical protein
LALPRRSDYKLFRIAEALACEMGPPRNKNHRISPVTIKSDSSKLCWIKLPQPIGLDLLPGLIDTHI